MFSISETLLQRRVSELERGAQGFREGGPTGRGEVRRICRERDQLKEVTSQMEAELIQVCHHIHKFTYRHMHTHTLICSNTQIQSDAKSLANDRDNFKLLYEQVPLS